MNDDEDLELRAHKGKSQTWALDGAVLPLRPPGRGGGSKPAPLPTEGGFRAAVATEPSRAHAVATSKASRAWDLAKLRGLCAVEASSVDGFDGAGGLNDWERDAFPSMLERLEEGRFPTLTPKQRATVDAAIERLELDVEEPEDDGEEVAGMRERRR